MIRFRTSAAALLLMLAAIPALADIKLAIGEPGAGTTRSGVGLISGWAISHEGVESVEALIDGESLGFLPYGSARGDVATAFPDYPDSMHSGWAMKWNYSLLEEGVHLLTVIVTDTDGGKLEKEVWFNATGFDSEFISDPEEVLTEGVVIESPEDGRFVVTGAVVEGKTVDFELAWDTAAQQFVIDYIEYTGGSTRKPPTVQAGADITVTTGESVSIEGSASDPDGQVASLKWSQVSGPAVSLSNTNGWVVQFTAPENEGTIRLRLSVTDNDGLTSSDDVYVTVEAPNDPPNDNTTGFALESMLPYINEARGVARNCGDDAYPAQPPLQWSDSLADIARQHAMDMASKGYFAHDTMDGPSMSDRIWPYWNGATIGENIAASSVNRSDSYIVNMWLESPDHCALIMHSGFTHAGVGSGHNIENGYKYHHFWTLDFGG